MSYVRGLMIVVNPIMVLCPQLTIVSVAVSLASLKGEHAGWNAIIANNSQVTISCPWKIAVVVS
jgi:hypothetical protein